MSFIVDYEKVQQEIPLYTKKLENLAKNNAQIKYEINKVSEEKGGLKQCIRCFKEFSPLSNNDVSSFNMSYLIYIVRLYISLWKT